VFPSNKLVLAAKAGKLKGIEVVQRVIVTHDEWTPENDLLTAAMKLKRGPVTNNFKKEVKKMYDEVGASAE